MPIWLSGRLWAKSSKSAGERKIDGELPLLPLRQSVSERATAVRISHTVCAISAAYENPAVCPKTHGRTKRCREVGFRPTSETGQTAKTAFCERRAPPARTGGPENGVAIAATANGSADGRQTEAYPKHGLCPTGRRATSPTGYHAKGSKPASPPTTACLEAAVAVSRAKRVCRPRQACYGEALQADLKRQG